MRLKYKLSVDRDFHFDNSINDLHFANEFGPPPVHIHDPRRSVSIGTFLFQPEEDGGSVIYFFASEAEPKCRVIWTLLCYKIINLRVYKNIIL